MTTRWENDRMLKAEAEQWQREGERRKAERALDYCYKCTGSGYDSYGPCRVCQRTGIGQDKLQVLIDKALQPFKKDKP